MNIAIPKVGKADDISSVPVIWSFLKKRVIKRLIIHQRANFGHPVKSVMIEKEDNCASLTEGKNLLE